MKTTSPTVDYDPLEEKINAISHAIGAVLALFGGFALMQHNQGLSLGQNIGLLVYSASLVLLFASSTFYHAARNPYKRFLLKKMDHTAIYYLIAGTYTPLLCIAIPTQKAHYLLIALWVIAALGTLLKLFFVNRFEKLSLFAYLAMGWLALLIIDDMREFLPSKTLNLIIIGGLAYTIGALFYALKRVKYTHAIWHVFVLLGAGSHFFAIYWYLIHSASTG
ncbi:PAQR family membrane homeostasis protein TrhA [Acinetobacter larvae]|uniref:Hemolysin III n=1 Tax=Acinetobacter larvae TaxID=1789224 RepID=A0A1B2M2J9_9GAMM|nr:hemolysin III family protein [Acinetobacter larvae]AOA59243.1 hemolysin III [Acinetobacter larvae]